MSSRRCWRPRTAASSSITASTSSAWRAPCRKTCAPIRSSRAAPRITQQLAKNLFLSNERTVERKVKEAFLAVWLEANLSKKEILQLYLDRAYMGGGTFGIAAAANFYFGKEVKDLDLAEAAMLAGLFKAPAKYAPHINLPAARARANDVLNNLVESGFMTEGQVLTGPAAPGRRRRSRRGARAPIISSTSPSTRPSGSRPSPAMRSMVARTTIDLDIQRAAEESLEFNLRQHGKDYSVTEGAIVVLDTNGSVRAIVGGRDYGESQFNRATQGAAPDRLVVQALCLRHRHGAWLHARTRWSPTGRSAGAAGRRRTTAAAFPAA